MWTIADRGDREARAAREALADAALTDAPASPCWSGTLLGYEVQASSLVPADQAVLLGGVVLAPPAAVAAARAGDQGPLLALPLVRLHGPSVGTC